MALAACRIENPDKVQYDGHAVKILTAQLGKRSVRDASPPFSGQASRLAPVILSIVSPAFYARESRHDA